MFTIFRQREMSTNTGHKVVLIGDSGVGKTTIVLQLLEKSYHKNTMPTVGSGIFTKKVPTDDGVVILTIWDTAGEEKYRSFTGLYSQGACAAIIVFDVTDKTTFSSVDSWVKVFQLSSSGSLIYIVGNKIDKEEKRQVKYEDAYDWANQRGFKYNETSAKTGENVELIFKDIATSITDNITLINTITPISRKSSTCKKVYCC